LRLQARRAAYPPPRRAEIGFEEPPGCFRVGPRLRCPRPMSCPRSERDSSDISLQASYRARRERTAMPLPRLTYEPSISSVRRIAERPAVSSEKKDRGSSAPNARAISRPAPPWESEPAISFRAGRAPTSSTRRVPPHASPVLFVTDLSLKRSQTRFSFRAEWRPPYRSPPTSCVERSHNSGTCGIRQSAAMPVRRIPGNVSPERTTLSTPAALRIQKNRRQR